jgi:hypothetical protein
VKTSYKKYLIISAIGALIIGLSFYLFLNNRLDRVEIVVAANNIEKGEELTIEDIDVKEYYTDSLPEDYLVDPEAISGKKISIARMKGDPITETMFDPNTQDIKEYIDNGEILISINPPPRDYIVRDIKPGDLISIVSTEEEKMIGDEKEEGRDISILGRQLILRGLQVILVREITPDDKNILIEGSQEHNYLLYLACEFDKVATLAKMTKDGNYKIFFEKNI